MAKVFRKVLVKLIYSENATKLCKVFAVHLTITTQDKSTVDIFQNFCGLLTEYMNFTFTYTSSLFLGVVFSEHMNFKIEYRELD